MRPVGTAQIFNFRIPHLRYAGLDLPSPCSQATMPDENYGKR